jgi:hypothetical protein
MCLYSDGRRNEAEEEVVGAGASKYTKQHGQSSIDMPKSRPMEGGRRTASRSIKIVFKGVGAGASIYASQRGQSSIDVPAVCPKV